MKKKAKRIALIGLDGCGKSAQINLLKANEEFKDFKFVWARWSPFLLKPLYAILNRKNKSQNSRESGISQVEKEKNQKKKKLFSSPFIRWCWEKLAVLDYFTVFHLKTVFYRIAKKNIIFDRYFIDLIIDLGVNFGWDKQKTVNKIYKKKWLFPKLNKYLYINVSKEICFERKLDIPSMDYLEKREEVYELLKDQSFFTVIDGERDIDKVNQEIVNQIKE